MGALLFTVGGAFLGSFFGPVGASIGGMLGQFAWNLLDAEKSVGPRMNDTKVQGADYGAFVPILYGKMRVGGIGMGQGSTDKGPNEFTEVEEESSGKGGMFGGGGQKTFSYKLSFFNAICQGPIAGVERCWVFNRFVIDVDVLSDEKWSYTLYLGDNEQMPDPTMEMVYGTGEVAPVRGVAYESVEELALKDFGQGRPNVEYEAFTEAGPIPVRISTFDPFPAGATSHFGAGITYDSGLITVTSQDTLTTTLVRSQFQLDGTQVGTTTLAGGTSGGTHSIRNLHAWYVSHGMPAYWHITDPDDPSNQVALPGLTGVGAIQGNLNIYMNGVIYGVDHDGPSGDSIIGGSTAPNGIPDGGIFDGDGPPINGIGFLDDNYPNSVVKLGTSDTGDVYAIVGIAGAAKMWKFDANMHLIHFWDVSATSSTYLNAAGNFHVYKNQVFVKWASPGGGSNPPAGSYVAVVAIDPITFALSNTGVPLLSANAVSQNFIVSLSGCLMMDEIGVFSACPPSVPAVLGEIVSDQMQRAGLDASKIDMTDLTQDVRGFLIASMMTVHNAIDLLRQAFFFDVAEYDGKIVGVNRGHDAIANIPDGDLGAHEPGSEPPEPLEVTEVPPSELPHTVFVKFYNVDNDYQPGTMHYSRTVTESKAQVTLDLPIVLTPTEALQIAQWQMHFAWLERERFVWFTTRKWSRLVKTNVVVVRGVSIRITNKTESPNGLIKFEGVRAFAGPYAPYQTIPGTISGPPAGGQPPQTPPGANVDTQVVLLDIPFRSPSGNPFGFTAAMGPIRDGTWPGATLFKSLDGGVTYKAVASTEFPDIIGHTEEDTGSPFISGELASYGGGDVLDPTVIRLVLTDDDANLESVTDDALALGANLCAISRIDSSSPPSGSWELAQPRDVMLIAPKTWLAWNWLRGRHGTQTDGHASGDTFVVLPATNVDAPASELNVSLKYKAVTFQTPLADAGSIDFTNTGLGAEWWTGTIPPYTGGPGGGVPPPAGGPGTCRSDYVLNECGVWILNGAGGGSTSPLTTKGDLWGFSTLDVRVPAGTNGYVLYYDSTQTNGLNYFNLAGFVASALTSSSITGTGFAHVTGGALDGAATAVDLSGAHATGILAAGRFPALTGHVTTVAGALAATIPNNTVTNAIAADMATGTVKYRRSSGTGDPEDTALATLKADLAIGYTIEMTIGDGVNPIVAGLFPTAAVIVPRDGTLTGWTLLSVDAGTPTAGAIVIDLWKDTYTNYPPAVADSIIPSGTKPTITATNSKAQSSSMTGWTTSLVAGDVIFPNVVSVTGLKAVKLVLTYS